MQNVGRHFFDSTKFETVLCGLKIIVVTFCILFMQSVLGQSSLCDKNNLTASDKKMLSEFWTGFTTAVNSDDPVRLASYIKFPFKCDYCILDSTKEKTNYLNVTKQMFKKKQYKIFLDSKLKKQLNKTKSILEILYVAFENKKCLLNFYYTSVDPSIQWEGQQHFFSLEKLNGKFLITGAWTVP